MHTLHCSVYIGISLDGFIARPNGDIDWLTHERYAIPGDDFGYQAFFDSVDALLMGRATFEKVLTFGEWPYANKRVFVLSHNPNLIPAHLTDRAEVVAGSPADVLHYVATRGIRRVYLDGGQVIQQFLREGLVDELIITRLPVLIGQGLPLFGPLSDDIQLQHVETRTFSTGLVQSRYRVER
jgi:dihydrofolate reductase